LVGDRNDLRPRAAGETERLRDLILRLSVQVPFAPLGSDLPGDTELVLLLLLPVPSPLWWIAGSRTCELAKEVALCGGDREAAAEIVETDEDREVADADRRLGLSSNSSKLLLRPLLAVFFASMSSAIPFLECAISVTHTTCNPCI